ncbi:MAG: hypothetical protein ACLQVG_28470 [Terriglobia bacterium]
MSSPEGQEARRLRVNTEAQTPQAAAQDSFALTLPIFSPHEEVIPPANSIVIQIRNFRSPPFLG